MIRPTTGISSPRGQISTLLNSIRNEKNLSEKINGILAVSFRNCVLNFTNCVHLPKTENYRADTDIVAECKARILDQWDAAHPVQSPYTY